VRPVKSDIVIINWCYSQNKFVSASKRIKFLCSRTNAHDRVLQAAATGGAGQEQQPSDEAACTGGMNSTSIYHELCSSHSNVYGVYCLLYSGEFYRCFGVKHCFAFKIVAEDGGSKSIRNIGNIPRLYGITLQKLMSFKILHGLSGFCFLGCGACKWITAFAEEQVAPMLSNNTSVLKMNVILSCV
jgi:hypothetical protein